MGAAPGLLAPNPQFWGLFGRDPLTVHAHSDRRLGWHGTHSPTWNGRLLNAHCPHGGGGPRDAGNDASSTRCSGLGGPEPHGGIFPKVSGPLRPSTIASYAGRSRASGSGCSSAYATTSIPTEVWPMPRSFARTNTVRAEGGDRAKCFGDVSRGPLHENPRARGHPGHAIARGAHPGAAP